MILSYWSCPTCGESLFITNSARYWCSICQAEQDVDAVDPRRLDWKRNEIEAEMKIEQAMGISYERR